MGKSSCSAELGQLRSNGEDVLLILAVKDSRPIRAFRGILASWCVLTRSHETAQVQSLLLFWSTIIYWESAPHTTHFQHQCFYTRSSTIPAIS